MVPSKRVPPCRHALRITRCSHKNPPTCAAPAPALADFFFHHKSQSDTTRASLSAITSSFLILFLFLTVGISTSFGYDAATRLTSAILKNPAEAILKTHGWQYDPGNNHIASKTDTDGLIPNTHNKLNQLLTSGSGPTRIAGALDEPGTVKVNGEDARMRHQTLFEAYLELPPGTHQIEIPVLSTGAVLASEGAKAVNCATGAASAIARGWTKPISDALKNLIRF